MTFTAMILTFCGHNYTLLQVTNATPEEMNAIRGAVTATVSRFQRRGSKWDGQFDLVWYYDGYFYIPAACWKRIWDLREPDPQALRLAYNVEFRNQDAFFNKTITREDVEDFVASLQPKFDDIEEQITVLHSMIVHRMSSHNIATGFGKTFLSYILAQYTNKVLGSKNDNESVQNCYKEGKTLMIVPRVQLVQQGIDDFNGYQSHLEPDMQLKCYGICGGFQNRFSFDDANCYIATYQSLANMPNDMFRDITTVICDEGHTAKAMSVRDAVSKCINAELITSISGTIKYSDPASLLTIEQFCGPLVSDYPAYKQIEKGRLPRIAMQQIILQHNAGTLLYEQMLQQQRLPSPRLGYPPELASTYRSIEFKYLWSDQHLMNYILQLCKNITDQNKNVLVIFANRQPAINVFELANARGQKAHLILGGTPRDVRQGIKAQLENETGWILSATVGTMSMGISINNLHGIVLCMIGHSPHIVLQSIGRMLRNHPDKFRVTMCYDIVNDFRNIGTGFDMSNAEERLQYYKEEKHPIMQREFRIAENY